MTLNYEVSMRRFVLMSILFVACGEGELLDAHNSRIVPDSTPTINRDRPILPQDEALIKITDKFYADAKKYGVETDRSVESISFVDKFEGQKESIIGLCSVHTYSNDEIAKKTVALLKSYWQTASPNCRASLVYHELGHCALDLDHADKNAKAIMRPTVFCGTYAEEHWEELVRELFHAS